MRRARLLLVAVPLLGCVGCDQISKGLARAYLSEGVTQSFLNDSLRLVYTENPGAFLGLGASLPQEWRQIGLVAIVGFALALAIAAALFARRLGPLQVVSLALLTGGGLSNWLDRLTRHGLVTDFLNVGAGGVRTGIFNVADVAILVGALLLVVAGPRPERDGSARS